MRLHLPGRATVLHQIRPGACVLVPVGGGVEIGLVVCDREHHRVLILNRPDGDRGLALSIISEEAVGPDVFEMPEAVLAPIPALSNFAFGGAGSNPVPWALYLGDGCAFLRARGGDGELRTYEVASGKTSVIDLAYLPWVGRWRITVPDAYGMAQTLFEAGADASPAPRGSSRVPVTTEA